MLAKSHTSRLLAAALLLGGCAKPSPPAAPPVAPPAEDSVSPSQASSLASQELLSLGNDFWEAMMRNDPTGATFLGVPGYDHLLPDPSVAGAERARAEAKRMLVRANAIDVAQLSRNEQVSLAILKRELSNEIEGEACKQELWTVDHLWGPQVWLLNLGGHTRVASKEDRDNYLARLSKFGGYMRQHIAAMKVGLSEGLAPPRINVDRAVRQLGELAAVPPDQSPLAAVAEKVPAPEQAHFKKAVVKEVTDTVRPAFAEYETFLQEVVLPRARAKVGVSALPLGEGCYRAAIRAHTSQDEEPLTLHHLGLSEMKRIRAEMTAVSKKLFPGKSLKRVLDMLRDDEGYGFSSREKVEAAAVQAVARAQEKLPEAFSTLPKSQLEVKRLEAHLERDAPMAYYFPPSADQARSGIYYVNTYKPESRPKYTAEVLAFHEGVPGHHLQIATAMELEDVPEFQKHAATTAFTEGWGLYAERLSDELGLYSGDLDRLGMLSFDAWRAARLVVDTGLHSLGWSRKQAIAYMMENTASSLPDIENEVDRYITWPGQALAYKVGQLEILRLRAEAKKALGPQFNLREFHHEVLKNGGVPLNVLKEQVHLWIESKQAQK